MSAAAKTSTRSRLLQTPAIAVAIGTFGVASGRAPAGVVGPPHRVPVLVAPSTSLRGRGAVSPVPHRWAEPTVTETPTVLFVCVHNAGRSQMAAALLDHHAQGRVQVLSAGSEPADEVNPAVVEAIAELGLDISREHPEPLTTEAVEGSDVVITMGCGDACPVFPGKRYLDWSLEDPAGKGIDAVRPIRDDIDRRVQHLLGELLPPPR